MGTRRGRFDDLARKGDRSPGEEGEFTSLQAEEQRLGRFADEAGEGKNETGTPQTSLGEPAVTTKDNSDTVTGEPELKPGNGKKADKK